ncbi:MAG: S49 family peptidase [Gemmatimonadetes bacterium]|nr:S49 family peptidase [Gemmatimonadota bacterium]
MALLDTRARDRAAGVEEIEIVSSQTPRKRDDDPTTDTGRAAVQATVDALAAVFLAAVARYRGVPEATVLADYGQGGVFVGEAAVLTGLADRLGTYETLHAALASDSARSARAAFTATRETRGCARRQAAGQPVMAAFTERRGGDEPRHPRCDRGDRRRRPRHRRRRTPLSAWISVPAPPSGWPRMSSPRCRRRAPGQAGDGEGGTPQPAARAHRSRRSPRPRPHRGRHGRARTHPRHRAARPPGPRGAHRPGQGRRRLHARGLRPPGARARGADPPFPSRRPQGRRGPAPRPGRVRAHAGG